MHNPFTNNIVKKVNPKLKAVLIKSVDSPAVKVVFGSSDLCVFCAYVFLIVLPLRQQFASKVAS